VLHNTPPTLFIEQRTGFRHAQAAEHGDLRARAAHIDRSVTRHPLLSTFIGLVVVSVFAFSTGLAHPVTTHIANALLFTAWCAVAIWMARGRIRTADRR
jgi:hypothetical protein